MRIHVWNADDGRWLGTVDSREQVIVILATDHEKEALIDCENEGLILFPASVDTEKALEIVTQKPR